MASSVLGEPITLPFSGRVVANRIMKAPLEEQLATTSSEDGFKRGRPTPELVRLYEEWGKGGFGLMVTGNVVVHRDHVSKPADPVIDMDNPEDWTEDYAKIARAAKAHGTLLVAQVNHPGRQGDVSVNPNLLSASDIPLNGTTIVPKALTVEEIKDIVERHAYTSEVLYKAGFDGVQVHAAHGYLFTQFLSPRSNRRTDQYGGSLENRARIIFETIDAIRARVPDPSFIIACKLNTADFAEGGFNSDDSQKLALMLEEQGRVDLIELSGGTYEGIPWIGGDKAESTKRREAFFIEFAAQLRPQLTKTKLAVSGGFRSAAAMIEAISGGETDMIGLGRPAAAEPHFPKMLLNGTVDRARANNAPTKLGVVAATAQMGQIGRGERVWDLSTTEDVEAFMKFIQPVGQ